MKKILLTVTVINTISCFSLSYASMIPDQDSNQEKSPRIKRELDDQGSSNSSKRPRAAATEVPSVILNEEEIKAEVLLSLSSNPVTFSSNNNNTPTGLTLTAIKQEPDHNPVSYRVSSSSSSDINNFTFNNLNRPVGTHLSYNQPAPTYIPPRINNVTASNTVNTGTLQANNNNVQSFVRIPSFMPGAGNTFRTIAGQANNNIVPSIPGTSSAVQRSSNNFVNCRFPSNSSSDINNFTFNNLNRPVGSNLPYTQAVPTYVPLRISNANFSNTVNTDTLQSNDNIPSIPWAPSFMQEPRYTSISHRFPSNSFLNTSTNIGFNNFIGHIGNNLSYNQPAPTYIFPGFSNENFFNIPSDTAWQPTNNITPICVQIYSYKQEVGNTFTTVAGPSNNNTMPSFIQIYSYKQGVGNTFRTVARQPSNNTIPSFPWTFPIFQKPSNNSASYRIPLNSSLNTNYNNPNISNLNQEIRNNLLHNLLVKTYAPFSQTKMTHISIFSTVTGLFYFYDVPSTSSTNQECDSNSLNSSSFSPSSSGTNYNNIKDPSCIVCMRNKLRHDKFVENYFVPGTRMEALGFSKNVRKQSNNNNVPSITWQLPINQRSGSGSITDRYSSGSSLHANSNSADFNDLLKQAENYSQHYQYEKIIQVLEQAVTIPGINNDIKAEAFCCLGWAQTRVGQYGEAIISLHKALTIDEIKSKTRADALTCIGLIKYEFNMNSHAIYYLDEALSISKICNETKAEALNNRSFIKYERRIPIEADKDFFDSLALVENDNMMKASFLYKMSLDRIKFKHFPGAIYHLNTALNLNNINDRLKTSLLYTQGYAQYNNANFKEASRNFKKVILMDGIDPEIKAEAFNKRGYVKNWLRKYQKAIENSNCALQGTRRLTAKYDLLINAKSLGNSASVFNNIGYAKYNLGQYEEAVVEFNQALLNLGEGVEREWVALRGRGLAHYNLARYSEAQHDLEKSLKGKYLLSEDQILEIKEILGLLTRSGRSG